MKHLMREVRDDAVTYAESEDQAPVAVEISVTVKQGEKAQTATASEGKAAGKQLLTEG